jgi:hypothetical protein
VLVAELVAGLLELVVSLVAQGTSFGGEDDGDEPDT